MNERIWKSQVVRVDARRPAQVFELAMVVAFLAGLWWVAQAVVEQNPWWGIVLALLPFGFGWLARAYRRLKGDHRLRRSEPGVIAIMNDDIRIEVGSREHRLSRRGVVDANVTLNGPDHVLWVRTRVQEIFAVLEDASHAEEVLTALGMTPDQKTLRRAQQVFRTRLGSAPSRWPMWLHVCRALVIPHAVLTALVVWWMYGRHGHMNLSMPKVAFSTVIALTGTLVLAAPFAEYLERRGSILLVGADGLTLKTWWRRRFVPYDAIRSVVGVPGGAEVTLYSREVIALWDGEAKSVVPLGRIQSAMDAYRSEATQDGIEQLDRGGRPLDEWLAAVRRLAHDAGYRRGWLGVDTLARAVADGSAPAERRIAAALALSESDDPDLRPRVRVAIEACANEPLAIALEKALAGEIEADEVDHLIGEQLTATLRKEGQP